ncbi:MAG: ribonuclease E/G [Pseudomonadota bacterium]|jgi:ribonuclease E|nr:ribonuclease E/G [Alphaproteobacteria bacterium]
MGKKLLIDAAHIEETRVAVVDDQYLEEFDSEHYSKKQLKSNIYLAKVVRIEPSLQAAFVEYGGDKHGFLPFSEIHSDYYRIPVSDRKSSDSQENDDEVDGEIADGKERSIKEKRNYRYKIQEVIQKNQILLVQVIKEQRANKGAALSTFLSLAGRYCVLIPNAGNRNGGISRKIQDDSDRKRLKEVLTGLDIPEGMSLIVRTAGQERSKIEIRRDYEYLMHVWEEIREKTLKSIAPCLIHEEGDLVKRAIRDIYTREIDEVLVEGEEAHKEAKNFMKVLMPSHAKKVKLYKDAQVPLFHKFKVEQQIEKMMFPKVELPSGGSIVINHTEALVAIDVNSGRSTRERNIDVTALKTNLEAAQEIARQLRLRDLSGLLVIDFIDMEENSHINQVERKLKESLKPDRARIQLGRISQFGLLELSRQRLRPSLIETHTLPCAHCHGTGIVRSIESLSLQILRAIEREAVKGRAAEIQAAAPKGVDLYLLNQKRKEITLIESRFDVSIYVVHENVAVSPFFRIDILSVREGIVQNEETNKTKIGTSKAQKKDSRSLSSAEEDADVKTNHAHEPRNKRYKKRHSSYKKNSRFKDEKNQSNTAGDQELNKIDSTPKNQGEKTQDHPKSAEIIAPQFGKKTYKHRNSRKKSGEQKEKKSIASSSENEEASTKPKKIGLGGF